MYVYIYVHTNIYIMYIDTDIDIDIDTDTDTDTDIHTDIHSQTHICTHRCARARWTTIRRRRQWQARLALSIPTASELQEGIQHTTRAFKIASQSIRRSVWTRTGIQRSVDIFHVYSYVFACVFICVHACMYTTCIVACMHAA